MSPRPEALVAALHGVGASAASMQPVVMGLRQALPGVAVLALDAPAPFDQGGAGRQWFSIQGVSDANRAERLSAALPELWRMLDAHLRALKLERDQLGLFGFSQGAMMALAAGLDRRPPAAVAAIAGRLAVKSPLPATPGAAFYLSHGAQDQIVPAASAHEAAARLRAAGRSVALELLDPHDHSIAPSQIAASAAFFARALRSAEAA